MSHSGLGLEKPELMRGLKKGLHDVCQPLTTLQCRLYLGSLEDDPAMIREGMAKCQLECEEAILRMTQLQKWVEEQNEREHGAPHDDFATH